MNCQQFKQNSLFGSSYDLKNCFELDEEDIILCLSLHLYSRESKRNRFEWNYK